MTTLVQLYKNRCAKTEDGKYQPHFWVPKQIEYTEPSLYANPNQPCPDEWGVKKALSRSLGVNKYLEDDGAGYYVGAALRGSEKLPNHPIIKPLLQSNVKDEKFHQKGINDLCDLYSSDNDLEKAQELANHWRDYIDKYHPLMPVAVLETGVFMPVLGFWRVFGGSTVADAAYFISFDENRHVTTNRSILNALGYDVAKVPSDLTELVKQTLDWIFEPINIPENTTPGFTWNSDSVMEASKQLLEDGTAPELNDVAFYADWISHFESGNGYGRALV